MSGTSAIEKEKGYERFNEVDGRTHGTHGVSGLWSQHIASLQSGYQRADGITRYYRGSYQCSCDHCPSNEKQWDDQKHRYVKPDWRSLVKQQPLVPRQVDLAAQVSRQTAANWREDRSRAPLLNDPNNTRTSLHPFPTANRKLVEKFVYWDLLCPRAEVMAPPGTRKFHEKALLAICTTGRRGRPLSAKVLDQTYVQTVVENEDTTVFTPSGDVQAVFLKGAIPQGTYEMAYPFLLKAAASPVIGGFRGTAAGTGTLPSYKKDGTLSNMRRVPKEEQLCGAKDGVLGYLDENNFSPCRVTDYTATIGSSSAVRCLRTFRRLTACFGLTCRNITTLSSAWVAYTRLGIGPVLARLYAQ